MKRNNIIFWLMTLVLTVSCNKTEWDKEVPLNMKAKSDINQPIDVANYTINVEDIELTITGIRIHGERLQADDVDKIYNENVYISFSEPESINYKIDIPVGTYEKLEVSIDFDTAVSSSHFSGEISGNGNPPFQSSINIPFNFTKIENQNNDNIILIDEKSKFIEIIFDVQNSFNGINQGIWTALMNSNQGQSEIDLSSVVGAQFLEDINSNFISTMQIKISN